MSNKIQSELESLCNLSQGEQEDQDYLQSVVRAAMAVSEEDWSSLSTSAQDWVNVGSFCIQTEQELPDFGDAPAIKMLKTKMEEADAEMQESEAEEEAIEEKPKESKKTAKKAAKSTKPKEKEVAAKKEKKAVAHKGANGKSKDVEKGTRGRKGTFPLNAKIALKIKENPHRDGTALHKYFSKYKNGMTVQQALDAGIVWANLRYLSELGHIKVG